MSSYKSETDVKAAVKAALVKRGAWFFSAVAGPRSIHGIPDILACVRGEFWGIECKFGGNRATLHQKHHLDEIRRNGGKAFLIDEKSVAAFIAALEMEDGR